jgi:hypothetical protein
VKRAGPVRAGVRSEEAGAFNHATRCIPDPMIPIFETPTAGIVDPLLVAIDTPE